MIVNKRTTHRIASLAVFALAILSFAPPAWAYLDPGTGSMIISAVVGLLATAGLAVKTYWYKIKAIFRGDKSAEQSAGADVADAVEPERTTES